MFGYIRYDKPHLYFKDFTLYQALYCGLCKGIGSCSGNLARFSLTYDVTFFSLLLHNIKGVDVTIEKQRCFEHPFLKRPMAKVDSLTRELGGLNTILTYFKLTDDVEDGERGKAVRSFFSGGYKRAKREYPEIERIVREEMKRQGEIEKRGEQSLDIAADATATMVARLSDHFLGESATEKTYALFYALGKWIYLVDALDDYDKDKKKGNYNPFLLSYPEEDKKQFVEKHGKELGFVFSSVFRTIAESKKQIKFHFNTDLVDNILFRGLIRETDRVMKNEKINKKESKELTRTIV